MKRLTILTTCFIIFTLTSFSQGKIFTQEEANDLFGPVQSKILFNSKALEALLDTNKYIMFKMNNNMINILGENRIPLIKQFDTTEEDVYHLYDSKIIQELFQQGGETDTFIEMREEVLSIANGVYVMEISTYCPPCCPTCPD